MKSDSSFPILSGVHLAGILETSQTPFFLESNYTSCILSCIHLSDIFELIRRVLILKNEYKIERITILQCLIEQVTKSDRIQQNTSC